MVTVRGDSDEAHIQAVNKVAKTCSVYFYVPIEEDSDRYQKESGGRLERVHWDSMITISPGKWLDNNIYCKESTS